MTLDRTLWTTGFYSTQHLPWTCPSCASARLAIREGTLHDGQTGQSRQAQKESYAEPEWIDGRFSCILVCNYCGGDIALSGRYKVVDNRHYDDAVGETGDYDKYYIPEYFSDPPQIIQIPARTPTSVRAELVKSFHLFWIDPEACTNRIRASVEKLLTAQRIPQTTGRSTSGVNGKRKFRSLHSRLELFQKKNAQLAQALMAIKWIGNAGSHSRPVKADDALDGYELMTHVLNALYVKTERRIHALTRSINRRKGPRSRRGMPRGGEA